MLVPHICHKASPREITGCQLWYEADKSALSLVGSDVNTMSDLSGNGYTLTAGASTRRPTLAATGLSGRPTLEFVQSQNDIMSSGAISNLTGRSYFAVVAACRQDLAGTSEIWSNQGKFGYLSIDNNGAIHVTFAADYSQYGITANGVITVGTPYIISVVFDGTQASLANRLRIYVNGALKDLTFSATLPTTIDLTGVRLGSHQTWGLCDGSISAIAWFSDTAPMRSSDRARLECAWGAKYGAFT